jgi:glycosyltransferase involved in cell wall biosynthesis
MEHPLVSVVLAVRNGERYLASAIESVLAQDYRLLEVVVVDGQSSDKTAEVAQSFVQVRYVRQMTQGISNAYNLGIEVASGDMIAFISHDDLWASHKLRRQVECLMTHPQIQYVICHVKFFLQPGCEIPRGFRAELLHGEHVGRIMETLLTRREVFEIVGRFNANYATAEDVDWYARAKDLGLAMAIIPEALVFKRVHDRNSSLSDRLNSRWILSALRESIRRRRGV